MKMASKMERAPTEAPSLRELPKNRGGRPLQAASTGMRGVGDRGAMPDLFDLPYSPAGQIVFLMNG
jgi:hypothetical protein